MSVTTPRVADEFNESGSGAAGSSGGPGGNAPWPPEARSEVSWVSLVRTARAAYGLLGLVGAALILPPQMRDMLAALAEDRNVWAIAAFPASMAVFGFLSWYWARAAISARFDLPDTRAAWDEAVRAGARGERPALREAPLHMVPQGPIPLAGLIGLATAVQSGAYGLGFATLVCLLLVWFGVDRRRLIRDWVAVHAFRRRLPVRVLPPERPALRSTASVRRWWRAAPDRFGTLLRRAPSGPVPALLLLGASVLVFCITAAASLWPAHRLDDWRNWIWLPFRGPTPVLLGCALIVGPLTAASFVADGLRVQVRLGGAPIGFSRPPVISGLIGLMLLAPAGLDLHALRVAGPLPARPTLAAAWSAWRGACGAGTRPIVVAVSGGASRAALWGMAVLAALDRETAGRPAAVFAISSVSGGSLGAAGYLAARAAAGGGCRLPAADMAAFGGFARYLGAADGIGPLLAGFVLSDVPRSLVGWFGALAGADLRGGDRAAALERAFEAAARRAGVEGPMPVASFEAPSLAWRRPEMPLWFGNATDRDTGTRALLSPVSGGGGWPFQGAADVLAQLGQDVPVSTAVNATARFPFLEPSGSVRDHDGGIALIDGGYYDQSGLETAIELAGWLRRQGADPILVAATGSGYGNGLGAAAMRMVEDDVVRCGGGEFRPEQPRQSRMVADVLAPVVGLYETRAGHVDSLMRRARDEYCGAGAPAFLHFYLGALGSEQVPLNWVLSRRMARHVWVSAGNDGGGNEAADLFVQRNMRELARLRGALTR